MSRLLHLIILQFLIFVQYTYAEGFKGFYGRIDSGITSPLQVSGISFENRPFGNMGVGYHFNDVFRSDLNIQYRKVDARKEFSAVKKVQNTAIMLNGYLNLTDSKDNFIPYFTAGLGYGRNKLHNSQISLSSTNISTQGRAVSNFMWSVGVGGVIKFTEKFGVDLHYRYIDLGTVQGTSAITRRSVSQVEALKLKIQSNEFGVGVIFNF